MKSQVLIVLCICFVQVILLIYHHIKFPFHTIKILIMKISINAIRNVTKALDCLFNIFTFAQIYSLNTFKLTDSDWLPGVQNSDQLVFYLIRNYKYSNNNVKITEKTQFRLLTSSSYSHLDMLWIVRNQWNHEKWIQKTHSWPR